MQGAGAAEALGASSAANAAPATLWERSYIGNGTFSAGGGTGSMSGLSALLSDPRKLMLLAYLMGGDAPDQQDGGGPTPALSSRSAPFTDVLPPHRSLLELLAASL